MKKKWIAVLLAIIAAYSTTMSISAADLDTPISESVDVKYEGVTRVYSYLITNTYTVTSECNYRIKSLTDYDYEITMILEHSSDQRNWDETISWSTTPTSTVDSFTKSYAPESGYYYRTVTVIDVYTKSGKYVESAEATSSAKYF